MEFFRGVGGPEEEVERRSHTLMQEFRAHYEAYVCQHPEHAARSDEIYQSWAIQKIAGLQLCVEALASKHNELIGKLAGL